MTDIVKEWVAKAEADFRTARRLMRETEDESPNYDLVCFLSQQCIEKYLKAYLQSFDAAFERTHDLSALLDLALPLSPLWESWRPSFRTVKDFAVEFRYPGEWAEPHDARRALEITTGFRADARRALGVE
jgi:HEPN domain-containing protein